MGIQDRIREDVKKLLNRAEQIYGAGFDSRMYTLRFKTRATRSDGSCKAVAGGVTCELMYNPLYFNDIPYDEYYQTVIHEVAHMVDHIVYGSFSHGKTWKPVMIQLGGDTHRCHSYEVSRPKKRLLVGVALMKLGSEGTTI